MMTVAEATVATEEYECADEAAGATEEDEWAEEARAIACSNTNETYQMYGIQ